METKDENSSRLIWSVISHSIFVKQCNVRVQLSGREIVGSRDESRHCTLVARRLPQICFANPFSWKRRLKTSFSWVSTPPPLKRYGPRKLSRNLNNFVETFPLSSVWSSEDLECINLPVSGKHLHFCWGHLCRCLFKSSLECPRCY